MLQHCHFLSLVHNLHIHIHIYHPLATRPCPLHPHPSTPSSSSMFMEIFYSGSSSSRRVPIRFQLSSISRINITWIIIFIALFLSSWCCSLSKSFQVIKGGGCATALSFPLPCPQPPHPHPHLPPFGYTSMPSASTPIHALFFIHVHGDFLLWQQ